MPADVASMMERGTNLIRRMRKPVTARITKMTPSARQEAAVIPQTARSIPISEEYGTEHQDVDHAECMTLSICSGAVVYTHTSASRRMCTAHSIGPHL